MDFDKIETAYYDKFEEPAGCPFDGFPDEATEREFFETLQTCIDTGEPLTEEQRKRFFPLEFQDTPESTYI